MSYHRGSNRSPARDHRNRSPVRGSNRSPLRGQPRALSRATNRSVSRAPSHRSPVRGIAPVDHPPQGDDRSNASFRSTFSGRSRGTPRGGRNGRGGSRGSYRGVNLNSTLPATLNPDRNWKREEQIAAFLDELAERSRHDVTDAARPPLLRALNDMVLDGKGSILPKRLYLVASETHRIVGLDAYNSMVARAGTLANTTGVARTTVPDPVLVQQVKDLEAIRDRVVLENQIFRADTDLLRQQLEEALAQVAALRARNLELPIVGNGTTEVLYRGSVWHVANMIAQMHPDHRPRPDQVFSEGQIAFLSAETLRLPGASRLGENPDSMTSRYIAGSLIYYAYQAAEIQQEHADLKMVDQTYGSEDGCWMCGRSSHDPLACINYPSTQARIELFDSLRVCHACHAPYVECWIEGCRAGGCAHCQSRTHSIATCTVDVVVKARNNYLLLVDALIKFLQPQDWKATTLNIRSTTWSSDYANQVHIRRAREDLDQVQGNANNRAGRRSRLMIKSIMEADAAAEPELANQQQQQQ